MVWSLIKQKDDFGFNTELPSVRCCVFKGLCKLTGFLALPVTTSSSAIKTTLGRLVLIQIQLGLCYVRVGYVMPQGQNTGQDYVNSLKISKVIRHKFQK
jgi:hypothetical protein